MSFLVEQKTHDITVTSSEGEEATVTLRTITAGDRAEIEDACVTDEGAMLLGSFRLRLVEKAIVNWSLEVSPTPDIIANLEPGIVEQIFQAIDLGSLGYSPNSKPSKRKSSN